MAFPLMVRSIRLSVEALDKGLEQAARTLGAGPLRAFFTVSLPLILPGLLTGTVLALPAVWRVRGHHHLCVQYPGPDPHLAPGAVFIRADAGGETGALRLCVIAVAVSLAAMVASEFISRRLSARLKG